MGTSFWNDENGLMLFFLMFKTGGFDESNPYTMKKAGLINQAPAQNELSPRRIFSN
jgi:hypothetical protein